MPKAKAAPKMVPFRTVPFKAIRTRAEKRSEGHAA
jgi:hypothetical protein